jgi:galactose mutarotase-like enzyme
LPIHGFLKNRVLTLKDQHNSSITLSLFADRDTREYYPIRIGFGPNILRNGKNIPFPLVDRKSLPLVHNLFDDDAIILKNMAKEVSLFSPNNSTMITLTYPDMHYLGIWHRPRTRAEYVCIEPWSSLPGHEDTIEDLEKQSDLISLPTGKSYHNEWSITVTTN